MTIPTSPEPPLRILVVTSDPGTAEGARRLGVLHEGLRLAACLVLDTVPAGALLAERVAQLAPDMIVADAPADACAMLARIDPAVQGRRPVVLFTEDERQASAEAAMAAGVAGYVVAGLFSQRVAPVLQVALLRFRRAQAMLAELDATRHKLAERKIIERAKGLLMDSGRLSEEQAYQKLRGMAMNKNLKLSEIAQRILDVEDLLG